MMPGRLVAHIGPFTRADAPAWKGQVCNTYGQVIRLGLASARRVEPRPDYSILQGNRQFGYPLMAAKVHRDLGICRHVLDQMVVAGTHMVPFGSGISILDTFRPGPVQTGERAEARQDVTPRRTMPAPRHPHASSAGNSDTPLSWDWDPLLAMADSE